MSDCLFCGIVDGKIKANIVYQDDARRRLSKTSIPRRRFIFSSFRASTSPACSISSRDDGAMIGEIFQVAAQLARDHGIAESGFRVVVNSGADAGQSVFHLHYHLLGGRQMTWPPG